MAKDSICWCGSGKRRKFCHATLPSRGLLVVSGIPGVGKSATRTELASLIGDDIDELDWDECVRKAADKHDGISAGRDYLIDTLLSHAKNSPIIADALLGPASLARMKATGTIQDIPIWSVLLQCDEQVRTERIRERKRAHSAAMDGPETEGWYQAIDTGSFDFVVDSTRLNARAVARKILRNVGKHFWTRSR